MYKQLDQFIYSMKEFILAEKLSNSLIERLDMVSLQMKEESWDLSTRLSLLANIANDLDKELERR